MSFPVNNKKTMNTAIGCIIEAAETEEQLVLLVSSFILFFTATYKSNFRPAEFSAACVNNWQQLCTAQRQADEVADEEEERFMRPRAEDNQSTEVDDPLTYRDDEETARRLLKEEEE